MSAWPEFFAFGADKEKPGARILGPVADSTPVDLGAAVRAAVCAHPVSSVSYQARRADAVGMTSHPPFYNRPMHHPKALAAHTLANELNPEQYAAVTLPAQSALILAGAGSGKTRVLTTRIAWLLTTGQVTPGEVLAVTFTNKAAREMTARLSAMLPVNVRGMWIGTFHGLCNRFLRAHHKLANLPQTFQILDMQDQLSAIKRLCKQHNVDEERYPPKQLAWFINGCKEEGLRPDHVPVRDADSRRKAEIYALYEAQCQREGVVDFAELLLRSYELLQGHDAVREHYQRRFRHILIDEFQDTNRLQYAWIKLLAGQANTDRTADRTAPEQPSAVFAVGDDDQSIYAFRGARVGNMADFVREFGVSEPIKLEQNYRSRSNILDSANALISHNRERLGKNLRTNQGPGEPVRVLEAPSDTAEAQWMVQEMQQLAQEGLRLHEIAVLYRSNAQSRVVESALFNAGLPYRVYGGLRFFERAEVKHALAYLRLLQSPGDDTSFLRVVNFPPRGIGARSIEQLQDAAAAAQLSLYQAVRMTTGKAGANLGAFVALIDTLRQQMQGLLLREVVALVLERSGLLTHYQSERDGADRVENLQELINAAESFNSESRSADEQPAAAASSAMQAVAAEPGAVSISGGGAQLVAAQPGLGEAAELEQPMSPLAAFLTHAALESGDNQAQSGQDAVQLMTVHSSKGLEFDAVFISGLEEGLFPHENALSDRGGLEEERRLMYVAITRARQRLYLSHAQTRLLHGQTRYNLRSRFLDELPEAALKWITPKRAGWSSGPSFAGRALGGEGPAWLQETGRLASAVQQSPSPPAQAGTQGLRVGMQVFHSKFGQGKVLQLQGAGADERAQVSFSRHGVKWLALAVARLTPLP